MDENSYKRINPKLIDSFIPLPMDSNIPLSKEQLGRLFPNPGAWQDVIVATLRAEEDKNQAHFNSKNQR